MLGQYLGLFLSLNGSTRDGREDPRDPRSQLKIMVLSWINQAPVKVLIAPHRP
jgi:hypothetical protein